MKTHLSFATRDLSKSVAFYSTLLQCAPLKRLDDYALFITENPQLELALDVDSGFAGSRGAHFGVAVDTVEAVDRAIQRFETAGFETLVEREETCCYANQTKVWATDPDGRRWEVYTVHEETEARDCQNPKCCT